MSEIMIQCSKCSKEFWIEEGEAMEHKGNFLCPACVARMADTEPREKFEYKIETPSAIGISNIGDLLNKRGAEGWELVNISSQGTLVFKRRYME